MSTKIYNLLKFIVFCITVGAVIYLLNADHENTIYKGVKEGFEAGYTYGVGDCGAGEPLSEDVTKAIHLAEQTNPDNQ